MNKDIPILIELQAIDSKIIQRDRMIQSVPGRLSGLEKPLKTAETVLARETQRCDALDKKKKDKDQDLSEVKDRLNKLKTRVAELKTGKEFQAHQKEIDAREKDRKGLEESLANINADLAVSKTAVKNAEEAVAVAKKTIDDTNASLSKESETAKAELKSLKVLRKEIANKLDDDMYRSYMTILQMNDGLAVVEAVDETCLGCHMNVPPQLFVELKSTEELIICSQCKRILYFVEPEK